MTVVYLPEIKNRNVGNDTVPVFALLQREKLLSEAKITGNFSSPSGTIVFHFQDERNYCYVQKQPYMIGEMVNGENKVLFQGGRAGTIAIYVKRNVAEINGTLVSLSFDKGFIGVLANPEELISVNYLNVEPLPDVAANRLNQYLERKKREEIAKQVVEPVAEAIAEEVKKAVEQPEETEEVEEEKKEEETIEEEKTEKPSLPEKLLETIKQTPGITVKKLAETFGISEKDVVEALKNVAEQVVLVTTDTLTKGRLKGLLSKLRRK